jgi:hypothetical protein
MIVRQVDVVQAGAAQDEAHAFAFQRLERINDRRTLDDEAHPVRVKADGGWKDVVFIQQFEVGGDQLLLKGGLGIPHAIVRD